MSTIFHTTEQDSRTRCHEGMQASTPASSISWTCFSCPQSSKRLLKQGGVAQRTSVGARSFRDDDGIPVTEYLSQGDETLPPLVEVTLQIGGKDVRVVKPPGTDDLWGWYEQTGNMEADPSWGRIWETSRALSQGIFLGTDKIPELKGKRVVEVGCGLGLAGITAAVHCDASVIFCDREPLAIHCALSSAAVNGLKVVGVGDAGEDRSCAGALLDWSNPQSLGQPVDVVLGADCLYDPGTADLLAGCCYELVAGKGTVVLAEPAKERALGCRDAFLAAANARGALSRAEVVSIPPEFESDPPSVLVIVCWE